MFRKAQDLGLGLEVQDEFSAKIKESNQHPQSVPGLSIQKKECFFFKVTPSPPLWKHFFSQTLGMFERFNSLHGEKMIFRAKWIIFWGIQCKKGWKKLSVEYWSDSRPRSARWCVVPWFLKEVWGSTLGSLSDFHFVGFDFQFWFFPLRSSKIICPPRGGGYS